MKRPLRLILALLLTVAAASTYTYLATRPQTPSLTIRSITPAEILKFHVEMDLDPAKGDVICAETTSPDAVRSLVSVLQQAAETERHTCVSIGRLQFHMSDGRTLNLSILPGHDPRFYEFRDQTGDYRVNRAAFFAAMSACGMQTDALVPLDQRSAPVSSTSSHRQLP